MIYLEYLEKIAARGPKLKPKTKPTQEPKVKQKPEPKQDSKPVPQIKIKDIQDKAQAINRSEIPEYSTYLGRGENGNQYFHRGETSYEVPYYNSSNIGDIAKILTGAGVGSVGLQLIKSKMDEDDYMSQYRRVNPAYMQY